MLCKGKGKKEFYAEQPKYLENNGRLTIYWTKHLEIMVY